MKKIALFSLAWIALASVGFADDQLRNVQTELKSLGFYYGDVNGQSNAETGAAIRRYQIRNGLEVTGSLNQETTAALGLGGPRSTTRKAPIAAVKPTPAAPLKPAPPVDLRRGNPIESSDREFLQQEETSRRNSDPVAPLRPSRSMPPEDSAIIDPPAPLDAPSADFPVLFADTPFANAPVNVQQQTLRKAQSQLASRGFYRDVVDGLPGPATEEALLSYQRVQRLTLTGRLDLNTLSQLRLLPGAPAYSGAARAPQRVYRGIWLNRGGLRFGVEFD